MLNLIIITAIITACLCYIWHYLIISQAIDILERSRDRLILREDKRLKAGEIAAFIKRHK